MNDRYILSRKVHLPKKRVKSKKTKKITEVICTLNNVSSWIRFGKTKIKNDYKSILKEYILPESEKQYDSLVIQYRIIRHTKQKLDKDNVVFALKWIADSLEELGYVKDDRIIDFESYPTIINKNIPETMLEFRLLEKQKEW